MIHEKCTMCKRKLHNSGSKIFYLRCIGVSLIHKARTANKLSDLLSSVSTYPLK